MAARRPQSPFALDAADAAACGLVPSAFELTLVNDAAAALPDDAPVFDALGQISTPAAVRARLLRTYVAREAEATLRVDIELELLRQRCFAERNAQWGFAQPADFDWRPSPEAARWAPALVANTSVALRRLRHDAAAEREDKDAAAGSAALAAAAAASGGFVSAVGSGGVKKDERGFPLGQFSRERPWPPREFTQRAAVKPVRQRGGKRKAPAAVVEERSIFSKVCVACRTQSTPLWRKLPRDGVGGAKAAAKVPAAAQLPASGTAAGSAANGEVGDAAGASGATLPAVPMADVCLACFLKIQRSDLFARKKAEHERKLREQKERAAAERALEKKRLKQQTQLLKKHQQTPHQQPQQPPAHVKSKKRRTAEPQPVPPSPVPSHQPEEPVTVATPEAAPAPIKIVLKTDEQQLQQQQQQQREWAQRREEPPARKDAAVAQPPPHRSAKRDRKKSKKDKKKKKKKRKRAADSDSDDDDDDAPLPSPPQISGQYEYADVRKRAAQSSAKPSFDEADEEEPVPSALLAAAATREKLVEADEAPKRSRKPVVRIDSGLVSAPPVQPASASSSSSSLRKRRNSVVAVATATAAGLPDEPVKPSSRPVRSKTPVAAAATAPSTAENALPPTPAAAAAVSPAAGALGARKRARAKKESARERELRALGQYCPVCNAVYEEDDESTFVCCDSCEMWVHGSCDPTLTAAAIAALSDSNEKYICPLCAG